MLSGTLADNSGEIETAIKDTANTMANLRDATGALEEMASGLKSDSARLAERADAALSAIETMAGSIEDTVSDTKEEVST